MTLRFSFRGDNIGRKFEQAMTANYGRIADASRAALTRAQLEIKTKGDLDIKRGGNFGQRWIDSLQTEVSPARGRTINIILRVFHTIPYAGIHEFGGIIHGNPLLWIPLSWTGLKMRAREYGRRYGLFRVDREGKNPLLLSMVDKEPKYVGVESVKLKQRFHLRRIIRETAQKLPDYYARAFRQTRGRR